MNTQQRTIVRLWRDAVASGRPDPLYLAEGDGDWTPVPLAEAARRVDELANGLLALGVRKGDSFGILAGTRVEWCLFDFALALVGGVTAPVYANSSPEDCRYVLAPLRRRRRARRGRGRSSRRSRPCAASCPPFEHVLTFADLDGLAERGRAFAAEQPSRARRRREPRSARTTSSRSSTRPARPGRRRPARSSTATTTRWRRPSTTSADVFAKDDLLLLYLPLAHNFGRLTHLLAPMAGYTIAFCADPVRSRRCAAEGQADASSRACRASTRRSTRPSSRGSTRPRALGGASSTGRSTSGGR